SFPRTAVASRASRPMHSAPFQRTHHVVLASTRSRKHIRLLHGDSNVSPTTPSTRREGQSHEELHCIGQSHHASHPVHRERHCSRRGFHGVAGTTRPRGSHTATRARQHSGTTGEQSIARGSRCRYSELRLSALCYWLQI